MFTTVIASVVVLAATAALSAPTAADKCQASKSKAAGTYYACRQKAEATAVTKGASPVYTKCTDKFNEKWNGAEATGEGSCPDNVAMTADFDAYLAGQATEAAGIIAGTKSIPRCGDGAVNLAGEHCDGASLDGYSCASFGLHGSLACTAACDFNLSGCTSCPSPGYQYGGACWVMSAVSASCDTACATLGLVYDEATSIIAGSEGSDTNCSALLDAFGFDGVGLDWAGGECSDAVGCAVITDAVWRTRCGSPATDSTSFYVGAQRVCACR